MADRTTLVVRVSRTYNKPGRFDVFVESVDANGKRLGNGFYIEAEADCVQLLEHVSHPGNPEADLVWEIP